MRVCGCSYERWDGLAAQLRAAGISRGLQQGDRDQGRGEGLARVHHRVTLRLGSGQAPTRRKPKYDKRRWRRTLEREWDRATLQCVLRVSSVVKFGSRCGFFEEVLDLGYFFIVEAQVAGAHYA